MTDLEFVKLYKADKLDSVKVYTKGKNEMICAIYEGKFYIRFCLAHYILAATRSGKTARELVYDSFVKEFNNADSANRYFKACKGYSRVA